jgi:hypothetical protein
MMLSKSPWAERAVIFFSAFLLRSVLGYIFYGSIDVSAFIAINKHTFNDTLSSHPYLIWCAFPILPFYLWLSGLLTIKTSLPLAFCFKIIPILFDALLALVIYDTVKRIRPPHAFVIGLLYACSPISLIITCIHGQWDALPLFFLVLALYVRNFYAPSWINYMVYGALFAFSFLLKPLSLIFLPLFFVPFSGLMRELDPYKRYIFAGMLMFLGILFAAFILLKTHKDISLPTLIHNPLVLGGLGLLLVAKLVLFLYLRPWKTFSPAFKSYLKLEVASIVGLCGMMALCCSLLALYGFNIVAVVDKVLRYCNVGIATFGLPFAYPFNQEPILTLLKNRFWIMGLIGVVAVLYYQSKLDIYQSILLSFAFIFAFAGLSPQYVVWILPFMLLAGFYKTAAVFNLLFTIFCLLYYANPMTNPEVPYQSMLSFAPLKGCEWLLPPDCLTQAYWIPMIRVLGNYLIPFFCLGLAGYILCFVRRQKTLMSTAIFQPLHNLYLWGWLGLSALIAGLMCIVNSTGFGPLFLHTIDEKMTWYATHQVHGQISGAYGALQPFNIIFILLALMVGWSWCLYAHARD